MTAKDATTSRNEDIPFHYEKLFAATIFLELLRDKKFISIDLKPDRIKSTEKERRIEDITKFFSDKIQVFQIKHSNTTPRGSWTLGDIAFEQRTLSDNEDKYKSSNIFKFYKSWQLHQKQNKPIEMFLIGNMKLGRGIQPFWMSVRRWKRDEISWDNLYSSYGADIRRIAANCNTKHTTKSFQSFFKCIDFKTISELEDLKKEVTKLLYEEHGIKEEWQTNSFILNSIEAFLSKDVSIVRKDIEDFIKILDTELSQEVEEPKNYIPRPNLESEIITASEKLKSKGGYLFLFAPSGAGKTILLSEISKKNTDFMPYFCRIRSTFDTHSFNQGHKQDARLNAHWFRVDILQELWKRGLIDENISLDRDQNAVIKLYEEKLEKLSESIQKTKNKKIVIIVDAIDQVVTDNVSASVTTALLTRTFPGVVFLISTWGESYVPERINDEVQGNRKKILQIDTSFTETEVSKYFKKTSLVLSPNQIERIHKKTKGLAISLYFLFKILIEKDPLEYDDIINTLPISEDALSWYRPIWRGLSEPQKEHLGMLSFHFDKVRKSDLYNLVGASPVVFNDLMTTITPFIKVTNDYIEPYHDSFRRFISNNLRRHAEEYHSEIATYYSKENLGHYSKKNLIYHLEELNINARRYEIKDIYINLVKNNYLNKVLKSNLDYLTKVKIGRKFLEYFHFVGDIKAFCKTAVVISSLAPLEEDSDTYALASIGTDNCLEQIERDLSNGNRQGKNHSLKKMNLGNMLIENKSANAQEYGRRLIEDATFQIVTMNAYRDIFDTEQSSNIGSNIRVFTKALLKMGKYKGAINFIKKGVKYPKPLGIRAEDVALVNICQYRLDKKIAERELKKSPQLEILVTLALFRDYKPSLSKEYSVFKNTNLYGSLSSPTQILSVAEKIFGLSIPYRNKYIKLLLSKVKNISFPYYNFDTHFAHFSWSGFNGVNLSPREFFSFLALSKSIDRSFSIKDFYEQGLKKEHNGKENSFNDDFNKIMDIYADYMQSVIKAEMNQLSWRQFSNLSRSVLRMFNEKIAEGKGATISRETYNKEYKIYEELVFFGISQSVSVVSLVFPHKLEAWLDEIQNTFVSSKLNNNHSFYLWMLNSIHPDKMPKNSVFLEEFIGKSREQRKHAEGDNMSKKESLLELATTTASLGFPNTAEEIYQESLKYSLGIAYKGEYRLHVLGDVVRTRDQYKDYIEIENILEKVSSVMEDGGNIYYSLLESGTVNNADLGLKIMDHYIDDGFSFNLLLSYFLSAYVKTNIFSQDKFDSVRKILDMVISDDYPAYNHHETIQKIFKDVILWAEGNQSHQRVIIDLYIDFVKKYVYVKDKIELIRDLIPLVNEKTTRNELISYQKEMEESYRIKSTTEPLTNISSGSDYRRLNIKKYCEINDIGKLFEQLKRIQEVEQSSYRLNKIYLEHFKKLNTKNIKLLATWFLNNGSRSFWSSGATGVWCALLSETLKREEKQAYNYIWQQAYKYLTSNTDFMTGYVTTEFLIQMEDIGGYGFNKKMNSLIYKTMEHSAGSVYSFYSFVYKSSGIIEKYCPDVKKYLYQPLRQDVNNAVKLSLE